MSGPVAAMLPGERLHLQHGPIDLVIGVDPFTVRDLAFRAAARRFSTVLAELTSELPMLRTEARSSDAMPTGDIAQRMDRAVRPHSTHFVTRMAAVAGAVADTVLHAMTDAAPLDRAYVNNGGDIAIHLGPGQSFRTAMRDHQDRDLGLIQIHEGEGIGGIASSGRHGRSHSLGIADNVTVLAKTSAEADVAATLIANAVDLPGHPAIRRVPAQIVDPDSDLRHRAITQSVGLLSEAEIAMALSTGLDRAHSMRRAGQITAAALHLMRAHRETGPSLYLAEIKTTLADA